VREDWRPTLLDRLDYPRWADQGSKTVQERAKDKVKEIIKNHRAAPLPEDVVQKLNDFAMQDNPVESVA